MVEVTYASAPRVTFISAYGKVALHLTCDIGRCMPFGQRLEVYPLAVNLYGSTPDENLCTPSGTSTGSRLVVSAQLHCASHMSAKPPEYALLAAKHFSRLALTLGREGDVGFRVMSRLYADGGKGAQRHALNFRPMSWSGQSTKSLRDRLRALA